MKEYKVEARTYYSKVTLNKRHITDSSAKEIQEIMDKYSSEGCT